MNIGEISNDFPNNGINGAGAFNKGAWPGRHLVGEQHRPIRHPATARLKWCKGVNKVVMECYFRRKPVNENGIPTRGYRQRLLPIYKCWHPAKKLATSSIELPTSLANRKR